MNAGTGQPEHRVARHHPARQQMPALRGADREAGEVVVALAVQSGHLRRLAAHQGAARLVAARGDAGDHLPRLARVQPAGREVIQEEQRFGALHHDVVHAHRHQIDADGVMDAGLDRHLELGADAVGAGDQHRIGKSRGLQVEQRTEAAQPAHHAAPIRRPRERLDRLHQRIGRRDVHAGGAVGQAIAGDWFRIVITTGHAGPRYATALVRRTGRWRKQP